ncbi:Hpt domain-containing protein [Oscillatoria acuminata]|uniref:Chemotaxis protein histidine kinase-like protein n=1 Tax=Oscillatoria acuminata PCC 6304 TaxID=56110 RepID=K9TL82_9CYAN|nr:Hpt domain-containing protein [Oscillatoria acuminata]AFY83632.1 chemotaxis protein histidine kinase-like protein [Oscillatoria acuminata PCC 6304]
MDPEKQQQIMGYFIEEAREHLETIEKGLLELQSTMNDQEQLNELFRAAHSVKGGAAMLGFGSIQKTAHSLEDCFKILKEEPVPVDQKLETLFLKGYDTLQKLLERLQGPFGLREEDGAEIVKESQPVFEELKKYLDTLVKGGGEGDADPTRRDLGLEIANEVINLLRQMLMLFKQKPDAENRKRIGTLCNQLAEMSPQMQNWQSLVKTAAGAIANPSNSYDLIAPVTIKELKYASDFIAVGKPDTMPPSSLLLELAGQSPKQAGITLNEQEFIIKAEPQAAAKKLIETFDKKQLTVLTKLLVKAVKS